MIHSCAGGVMKDKKYFDFVKVEILSMKEKCWCVSNLPLIAVGDVVFVPYGKDARKEKAKVLRIDRNVSEQVSPVPIRSAREILGVCDE